MKKAQLKLLQTLPLLIVLFALATISSCKKDDDDTPQSTTYDLKSVDVLGVSGTVTFTETSSNVTTIEINLTGVSNTDHPAHIHFNSAAEGGGIALTLNPVDANGKSVTEVTKLDDNTPINYSQLIVYDGYLNVHQSATDLSTIIAQGDIGGNQLTTTNKTYNLTTTNSSGVAGTALFQKRKNGNTLVTLSITGGIPGDSYPAHIHLGSTQTVGGGPITRTFNNVDGTTGKSVTHIEALDDATPITYDQLLQYDGYINVHSTLGTIICQGNIGSN